MLFLAKLILGLAFIGLIAVVTMVWVAVRGLLQGAGGNRERGRLVWIVVLGVVLLMVLLGVLRRLV